MQLPNSENAFIDLRKLETYCFNPEHVDGKHKAYLFSKLLGLTERSIDEFRTMLLDFIRKDAVVRTMLNEYGMTYQLILLLSGTNVPLRSEALGSSARTRIFPASLRVI